MPLKISQNYKRAILPILFALYIIGTLLAFLEHAQYFKKVLAATFAQPIFAAQNTVNMDALNRVATLINIDQNMINALTSPINTQTINATSTPLRPQNIPGITPPTLGTSSASIMTIAATTSTATTTAGGTTTRAKRKP